MKDYQKVFAGILISTAVLVALTGCSKLMTPQKQNDTAMNVAVNTPAPEEGLIPVKVKGGFVAKVRHVIPGYCLDNSTPQVAVVTRFQSLPFTVYLGEKKAAELKIDETYYFEIDSSMTIDITQQDYDKGCAEAEKMLVLYNLRIASVRVATEEERGMVPIPMQYVKV
ncbi:MAG: hypothetical protein RSD07_03545 [Angelakisella sp.]